MRFTAIFAVVSLTLSGGCLTRTRTVVREPEPCIIPKPPEPPEIGVQLCHSGPEEFICMAPVDAATLAAWANAMIEWAELAGSCPGVDPSMELVHT